MNLCRKKYKLMYKCCMFLNYLNHGYKSSGESGRKIPIREEGCDANAEVAL